MTAAYHVGMEVIILLYLLTLSDRDGSLRRTLDSFLRFYRENRELLVLLMGEGAAPQKSEPPAPPRPAREQAPHGEPPSSAQKNRPPQGADLRILEQFLSRRSG